MNQAWKIAGYFPRHWPFRGHDNDAVHRSDFTSVDPLADRPTQDETSAKVREICTALKGVCVAFALIPFLALCRTVGPVEIPPDAKMGEIHPDTPVTNLVAQTVERVKDLHYDRTLGVTWRQVIDNGFIHYICVTNSDVTAK